MNAPRLALAMVSLCVALVPGTADAQAVYRCGPQRNVYSQRPCTDGAAVDARDGRTAQQRAESEAAARQQAAAASRLERDRLAREADSRPSAAASLTAIKPVAHAASAPTSKPKKSTSRKSTRKSKLTRPGDDDARAIVPAAGGTSPTGSAASRRAPG